MDEEKHESERSLQQPEAAASSRHPPAPPPRSCSHPRSWGSGAAPTWRPVERSPPAWNQPPSLESARQQTSQRSRTHHVQLLLQRPDLRLHHPQQLLHLLVAADGATGGSWRTKVSVTTATTHVSGFEAANTPSFHLLCLISGLRWISPPKTF